MAFPDNAIIELRIQYVVNQQRCMNVTHWDPTDNAAGRTPYEACGELVETVRLGGEGSLLKEMLDFMSQDAVVDTIQAQCIWPVRYRAYTWEGAMAGNVAVGCKAQNVQAAIEKIGELADRHNLGSFHLGGVPDSYYTAGKLTVPALTQLWLVADALKGPIITSNVPNITFEPVILKKTPVVVDGKKKYQISGDSFVVDTDVKEELRVMNRRTVGRGI